MPNPELSQYHDHDTNTVYDLKDATGRENLATFETDIRKSIISIHTMANGADPDYTDWLFMSPLNKGVFVGQDQAFVRIHFNSSLVDYSKPVRFIYYFDETHGQDVYICNVVTNYTTGQTLGGHYKQGDVLDFIFFKNTYTFVLVGSADSADLSNYYTKTETDTLLNAKVSDNPTFTEAATRQNIASGETFAVILGKIKKFFSDLKTVAFSGSYNDLTDQPTIPAAQVQSDWNEADSSAVDYIKNKPNLANVATSGSYNDLSNTPNLATVATSGNYSDLSGTPTLAAVATSGDYADLSGTPTLATVATSGAASDVSYNNTGTSLTDSNVQSAITSLANNKADSSSLARVATTGESDDVSYNNGSSGLSSSNVRDAIDELALNLSGKQGTLTAGNNISINSSNVIEADARGVDVNGTTIINPNDAINLNLVAGSNMSITTNGADVTFATLAPGDYSGNTTASAVSVPNSTSYTELLTVALTKGTWLINWAASFPTAGSTNTGYRAAGLTTSSTGDPYAYMMQQVPAITNNTFTCLSGSCIYVATGSVTMRLKARQYQGTSGSALSVSPRLQVIRLL